MRKTLHVRKPYNKCQILTITAKTIQQPAKPYNSFKNLTIMRKPYNSCENHTIIAKTLTSVTKLYNSRKTLQMLQNLLKKAIQMSQKPYKFICCIVLVTFYEIPHGFPPYWRNFPTSIEKLFTLLLPEDFTISNFQKLSI